MNRILRIIGGIASALILGALGSGLWEKLLSPLLSSISDAVVGTLSNLSKTYQDSIYAAAANQATNNMESSFTGASNLMLFLMATIFVTSPAVRRSFAASMALAERSRRARLILNINTVIFLAFTATMMVTLSKISVASQVQSKSLRSLEIIRPSIGDAYYIKLRSDFYSMRTKKDFLALKAKIEVEGRRYRTWVPLEDLDL